MSARAAGELPLLLQHGFALIQQGRLTEAKALYARILKRDPAQFDALYFSGAIAAQAGRFADAEKLFGRAARVRPTEPGVWLAHGDSLRERGQFSAALVSYDRAIALRPNIPDLHAKRGITSQAMGQWEAALTSFDAVLAVDPLYADAAYHRGVALLALKRNDDAVAAFDQAVLRAPEDADSHYNRGIALQELARFADALASQDRAIAARPDFAKAWSYRGIALTALGRLEEAVDSHDRAIALQPDHAVAYARRGATRLALRRFAAALDDYETGIRLQPDLIEAVQGRGLCRLMQGDFAAGLPDYESRTALHPFSARHRDRMLTRETGSIAGKRLLIVGDVGLGDTLQFIRYLKIVGSWGAVLRIAVQPALHALLRSLDVRAEFVDPAQGDLAFDHWVSVMSLPYLCGTTLATIPADIPYLASEPARVARWRAVIGEAGFRIGICWQGAVRSEMRFRGFPLAALAGIARMPDVRLISLHRGVGEAQLAELPAGMRVETLGNDFDAGPDAFLDTAAVIGVCDLVITCDTSVAHLAGALGARTWLALNDVPDWRWMMDRADSPWYPTMRLFRQTTREDWAGVFDAMARVLPALLR